MNAELLSSDKYLNSLERKLQRMQGKAENVPEPTSKQMLHHLSAVKEAHMKRLTDRSDGAFESDYSVNAERIEDLAAVTFIQRKLCPERQALTVEELHPLVENDTLQAVTKILNEADDTASASHVSNCTS